MDEGGGYNYHPLSVSHGIPFTENNTAEEEVMVDVEEVVNTYKNKHNNIYKGVFGSISFSLSYHDSFLSSSV